MRRPSPSEIEPDAGRQTLGKPERELDRQPHVGRRHLGHQLPSGNSAMRVDDALGVHDDVDLRYSSPNR